MMTLVRFLRDTSGAVTVDWVVLTGVSVGFGLMILTTLASGALDMAQAVETALVQADVILQANDPAAPVVPVMTLAFSP